MTRVASIFGLGLLAAASLLPLSARANEKAMLDLIKALHDQGTLTNQTYRRLRQTLFSDMSGQAAGNAESATTAQRTGARKPINVGTEGKLSFSSGDGRFTAQIGGRVQADAAFYDSDKAKLGSGTELRRARLFM